MSFKLHILFLSLFSLHFGEIIFCGLVGKSPTHFPSPQSNNAEHLFSHPPLSPFSIIHLFTPSNSNISQHLKDTSKEFLLIITWWVREDITLMSERRHNYKNSQVFESPKTLPSLRYIGISRPSNFLPPLLFPSFTFSLQPIVTLVDILKTTQKNSSL